MKNEIFVRIEEFNRSRSPSCKRFGIRTWSGLTRLQRVQVTVGLRERDGKRTERVRQGPYGTREVEVGRSPIETRVGNGQQGIPVEPETTVVGLHRLTGCVFLFFGE